MVIDLRRIPDFHSFVYWLCQVTDEETLSELINQAEQDCSQIDVHPDRRDYDTPDEVAHFNESWRLKNSLEEFISIAKDEQ